MTKNPIQVYILAKNEERNIRRCLDSLALLNVVITVLDSGSTDLTVEIATNYDSVTTESHNYTSHLHSYNELTLNRSQVGEWLIILDADMILSEALFDECLKFFLIETLEVLRAPVDMYVEGVRMKHGSLYPPKPFCFKGGRAYFRPSGHGEAICDGILIVDTISHLHHDDRKMFATYLSSQARYASSLVERASHQHISAKDFLRIYTPIMIFVSAIFSYVFMGGFLSGRAGIIYAIDRVIAECVMYRTAQASQLRKSFR